MSKVFESSSNTKGKRIIIFDGDIDSLHQLESFFVSVGYDVITSQDGIESLRMIYNLSPDLIIISIRLSSLHGSELCHLIKQDEYLASIPVILLSDDSTVDGVSELALDSHWHICEEGDIEYTAQVVRKIISQVSERKQGHNFHLPISDQDIIARICHIFDRKLFEMDLITAMAEGSNRIDEYEETIKHLLGVISKIFSVCFCGIYLKNLDEIYIDICPCLDDAIINRIIQQISVQCGFHLDKTKKLFTKNKERKKSKFCMGEYGKVIVQKLKANNRYIGAYVIVSNKWHTFSDTERRIIEVIKQSLTVLLNNIVTFQEKEYANRRLEDARQKLIEFNKTLDAKAEERAAQLENLYEAGKVLTTIHEPERLLSTLIYMIINAIDAEVGVAVLFDGNTVSEKIELGLNFSVLEKIIIKHDTKKRSLFEYVLETGDTLILNKAQITERLDFNKLSQITITSLACLPLKTATRTVGIMLAVNKLKGQEYTTDDIAALKTLSSMATVAIQNVHLYRQAIEKTKLEADIKMAMEIQNELLPNTPPINSAFDVAAIYTPADIVGGDYYDYIKVDGEHTGFIVADVTGHGVPAAFIMTLVKSCVELSAVGEQSTVQLLSLMNTFLCKNIPKQNFVTMAYGIIDTQNLILRYSSAGHNPLLWYSANKDIFTEVKSDGLFLGLFENTEFTEITIELDKGDILLFYTDGLTEAKNKSNEFFGLTILKSVIQNHCMASAQDISKYITEALKEFIGDKPLADDMTFILVRINE